MNNKNKHYISWDEYFMGVAMMSAFRSKDPNTRVGACIVNKKKRIVGIGYNGLPKGCIDDEFPWDRDGEFLQTKYPYVVHAEANAILNSTSDLTDATIYVSLFPCHECVKLIIQSGISEIVYLSEKYAGSSSDQAAKKMLEYAQVSYRKLDDFHIRIENDQ